MPSSPNSRPCSCDRVTGPAHTPDQCRPCWLAAYDARYRRLWGIDPDPPCEYLGDELTGTQREARGLGHGRRWTYCLNPDAPLGPVVCPCTGCGPACRGYSPDTDDRHPE